jgi:hypothetical protein
LSSSQLSALWGLLVELHAFSTTDLPPAYSDCLVRLSALVSSQFVLRPPQSHKVFDLQLAKPLIAFCIEAYLQKLPLWRLICRPASVAKLRLVPTLEQPPVLATQPVETILDDADGHSANESGHPCCSVSRSTLPPLSSATLVVDQPPPPSAPEEDALYPGS